MHTDAKPPDAASFHRTYAGTEDQVVVRVRRDIAAFAEGCPVVDDLVLISSELATNAVVHSRSGQPGGTFTVRAEVRPPDFAWLEVEDQGGAWTQQPADDEHGRGLAIVAALAGEGNWTIEDGSTPGARVIWAWLNWPQDKGQEQAP